MVIGTFATVSAASTSSDKWYSEAVKYLENKNIANIGDTADEPMTRDEFVFWVAKIESCNTEDSVWDDEIANVVFTDVKDGHHKAAIAYAHQAGYIKGNGDGTFAPDKTISLAEASAVVVRLMRYESLVIGLESEWDTNYVTAAGRYCRAFDQVFYANTNSMNPNFELTKGMAAYILATIMNGINKNPNNLILCADGIDLGARFENIEKTSTENVYYIANLDRVSNGLSGTNSGFGPVNAKGDGVDGIKNHMFTNKFEATSNVTLISADKKTTIVVPGAEFLKALRVELGLNPQPNFMYEEAEINVYEYINVGTMLNVTVDKALFDANGIATITDYKQIKGFEINSNSTVVDTYLQLAITTNPDYVGYSAAKLKTEDDATAINSWKPVLPTSYDATMATSWTNVTKDATGKVTAATLNFKGVAYKYGTDIVAFNAAWDEMDVDTAVNTLINAAQGECYAVFNDVDNDNLYDTVYVKESHPFAYSSEANTQPTGPSKANASSGKYTFDIMTSMSNGDVVANTYIAWNNIGSVIYNRTVGYPNSGNTCSSDSYNLTVASTGKLQLVLCASNAHPAFNNANCVPLYYTVVDLAAFYSGIIENVSANYVDGYYTATIRCTDDVIRTVYIPVDATAQTKLDVTVGGATAEYTFDSSAWYTFLEDTKAAAIASGIFQTANVKDPAYLNWAAAWMAGKYIEFAVDADNKAICVLGTDASTGTTGFVAGVEKTTTGENTYKVTIAKSASVDYVRDVKYFNASNPLTAAKMNGRSMSSSFITNNTTIGTTTIVANDGNTYYKTNGQLWASTATKTADTYYVCIDANGKIGVDANGNYTDNRGYLFADAVTTDRYSSVSAVVTAEVRAAASGIFDWANYNVYNQLFTAGSLIDPNTEADAKVNAGKDLIYVTLMKDAGSNYVLYNAYPTSNGVSTATSRTSKSAYQLCPNGGNSYSLRWYANETITTYKNEYGWFGIEDGYILSIEEVAGSRKDTYDVAGNVAGYEALYNAKIGYGPYYDRAWDSNTKGYVYEYMFTEVKELQNFKGSADAILDTIKTYMTQVHENENDSTSKFVIVDTDAEKAFFTLANGFYVDKDGYAFELIKSSITYKKDDKGNLIYEAVKYDYASAQTEVVIATDVNFEDTVTLGLKEELAPYTTMTVSLKPEDAEGWFPGSYYITIDGVNYNIVETAPVVLVTPSAKGFDIKTVTVAELLSIGSNFFVTEWNAVIGAGNVLETIAVLGQKAGSTKAPEDPIVPSTNKLVYLDGTAQAYIRHDLYSNKWLVVSDKTAYALPTGEEVGAIYRSYPTYADADNAIKIDLGIEGGKWYIVNANNEIVSATDVTLLEGTITKTYADGTTIATMNGVKGVDISDMNTEYFYFNVERTQLNVADDNTNVKIIAKAAFDDLFADKEKEIADAQKAYDEALVKYEAGQLAEDRFQTVYVDTLENAKAALVEAKAASLDTYFNGQFWGFANSPLYKNFATAQGTFQQEAPTLTFNYVIVEDTLCVFSDSFSFGA
ncbi:MAG: S-layer homology domain-containing protein [Clostridia bacterium]|nr:S-layer homology domain-containing protein [Clostridia bacterium]